METVTHVDVQSVMYRCERCAETFAQASVQPTPVPAPLREVLSPREFVVMTYLPTRMTNREIAAKLFISTNTLKTHVKAIYRKLDATSRSDALVKARAFGRVGH